MALANTRSAWGHPGWTFKKHEWTHPAFPDVALKQTVKQAKDKATSEAWLREFCDSSDCPGYEMILKALNGEKLEYDDQYYSEPYYISSEYFHWNGHDAHSEIPDEFWEHAEIVTGKKFSVKPKQFTCSC